jgi:hypothetical protein
MTLIPEDDGPRFGVLDTSMMEAPNFFDIPEEKEDPKDSKAELEEMRRKQTELEARLNERKNFEQTYQPPQQHQFIPQSTQTNVDNTEFKKKLAEEFFRDPGETLTKVLLAADQNAQKTAADKFIPAAAMAIRNQISMFKSGAGMDEEVAKEFDALVDSIPDEQLVQTDYKHLQTHLTNIKRMAVGTAAEKGWAPKSSERSIPNYGGSGYAAPKAGNKRVQLTKEQAEAIEMLKNDPYYRKMYDTPQKLYDAVKEL